MKKKNKWLGAGLLAGLVAAIVGLYHLTVKYLMQLALDRKEPKNMRKGKKQLAGSKEFAEVLDRAEKAAEKLEKGDCQQVEITSQDGVRLVGHWYRAKNPKRVIVAMHGWRSSWTHDFGLISEFWHKNDCSVLYAEQRGQGNSGGEYMGFGLLERYDCLEWVHFVNEQTGAELPIYLGGVSMGATTVLMAAGLELPENVRGIVADCGFTSPNAIWKHVVQNNLHMPYGIYSATASDICKKKIQVGAKDYSTTDAMSHCKVPVLFIHGTDDHFVPVEMTYENYKACVAPKRLLVVPGAEHATSYLVDKNAYEEAIQNFWKDYDLHYSKIIL